MSIELSKVWFAGIIMEECRCRSIDSGMRSLYSDFISLSEISGGTFSTVMKLETETNSYAVKIFKPDNFEEDIEFEINVNKKMDELKVTPRMYKTIHFILEGKNISYYGIVMDLYDETCFSLLCDYSVEYKLLKSNGNNKCERYKELYKDVVDKMIEAYLKSTESGEICMDVKPSNFVVNSIMRESDEYIEYENMKLEDMKSIVNKFNITIDGDKRKRETWECALKEYNRKKNMEVSESIENIKHDVKIIDFTADWVFSNDIDSEQLELVKNCLKNNGFYGSKTYLLFIKTFGMLLMFITILERTKIDDDFKYILIECFKPYLKILKGDDKYTSKFIKSITYYFVFKDNDIRPLFQTYSQLLTKNKNLNTITKLDMFYTEIQNIINYKCE